MFLKIRKSLVYYSKKFFKKVNLKMTGEQICFHVNHDEKMKMREVGKTVHQKKYVKINGID